MKGSVAIISGQPGHALRACGTGRIAISAMAKRSSGSRRPSTTSGCRRNEREETKPPVAKGATVPTGLSKSNEAIDGVVVDSREHVQVGVL
jgi:hypothetical protein